MRQVQKPLYGFPCPLCGTPFSHTTLYGWDCDTCDFNFFDDGDNRLYTIHFNTKLAQKLQLEEGHEEYHKLNPSYYIAYWVYDITDFEICSKCGQQAVLNELDDTLHPALQTYTTRKVCLACNYQQSALATWQDLEDGKLIHIENVQITINELLDKARCYISCIDHLCTISLLEDFEKSDAVVNAKKLLEQHIWNRTMVDTFIEDK